MYHRHDHYNISYMLFIFYVLLSQLLNFCVKRLNTFTFLSAYSNTRDMFCSIHFRLGIFIVEPKCTKPRGETPNSFCFSQMEQGWFECKRLIASVP